MLLPFWERPERELGISTSVSFISIPGKMVEQASSNSMSIWMTKLLGPVSVHPPGANHVWLAQLPSVREWQCMKTEGNQWMYHIFNTAFDTTSHSILIWKSRYYGLDGYAAGGVENWLELLGSEDSNLDIKFATGQECCIPEADAWADTV